MRRGGVIGAGIVALVVASFACTKDPPGEVVLSFQTDMAVPKDVSSIVLTVTSTGRTLFEEQYAVGPTGVKLPSTFALVEGEKDEPVTVKLIALKGTKPLVLREVVTKIPKGRVAGMKMPIEWLCYGESSVKGEIRQAAENACPAGQTCAAGTCVPSDSFPLDDPYDAKAVFGGGDDKGQGGSCFATESCFAATQTVQVTPTDDGSTCAFTLDGVKNVALEPEDRTTGIGTGPNGTAPFLVPLDQGKSGFELQGSRVTLPRAVCARVPKGLRVYATRSCTPKTNGTPTCGAWSAVTKPAPTGADGGTTTEAGNPSWKSAPLPSPPAPVLRISGGTSGSRLVFGVNEGAGGTLYSCDAGACAAPFRCEAKLSAPPLSFTIQERTGKPPAIYAVVGPTRLEVAEASGACAQAEVVTFEDGAPAGILDVAATPSELFVLGNTDLRSCSMASLTSCRSPQPPLRTFTTPANVGKLDVGQSLAYIHGPRVGGCLGNCTQGVSSERDLAQDGAIALDIVSLKDNYFWVDQRGPVTTVRDCPNNASCGGLDLTSAGTFGTVGASDTFVYVGGLDGLYKAARPAGTPGPTPATLNRVEASDPIIDIVVDGKTVFYTTERGLFRFIDGP